MQALSQSADLSLSYFFFKDNQTTHTWSPCDECELPFTQTDSRFKGRCLADLQFGSTHTLLPETFGCVLNPPFLPCVRTGSVEGSEVALNTYRVCACVSLCNCGRLTCSRRVGIAAREESSPPRGQEKLPTDDSVCLWRGKQLPPPAPVVVCVHVSDHMVVATWQEQRSPNSSSLWSSSSSSASQSSSSFLEVGPRNRPSLRFIQWLSVCPCCDVIMQNMSTGAPTTIQCSFWGTLLNHNMYSITFNSMQD